MTHRLVELLRGIDAQADELRADALCQWARCTHGVIGLVGISVSVGPQQLGSEIEHLVAHAHAILDELPDRELALEELWNVVLLISVPWTRETAAETAEIAHVLLRWSRDTRGSRKIILWEGTTIADYLGPLGGGTRAWMPPTGDPLSEAVVQAATDEDERQVLEVLFKRRIEESDIDELIRILGRRSAR